VYCQYSAVYTKMFKFRRITLYCLEKRLSKHKMTILSKNLGGMAPLAPPGYVYVLAPLRKFSAYATGRAYLLPRAAWIVHYCWRTANNNWFYPKILPFFNYEEDWLLLTCNLSTCLSWWFVSTRCCTLTWVTKILIRAVSTVHACRMLLTPDLDHWFDEFAETRRKLRQVY